MAPTLVAWVMVVLQGALLLPFTTIAQGTSSRIGEHREALVRTGDEWRALWKMHSTNPAPAVDFSRDMVVGVFLGTRFTAGYAAEITRIESQTDRVVVEYVERQPPPGGLTAQVLTMPFHLVQLTRDSRPIQFRRLTPAR